MFRLHSGAPRARSAGRQRPPQWRRPSFESLEDRRLLAIVWANQGSNGNDSDNFAAAFGGNAGVARSIVQQAIGFWQGVLPGVNHQLTINAGGLAAPTLAVTSDISTNNFGQPESATITVGSTVGWFFDSTPAEHSEFTSIIDQFTATGPVGGTDLLSVMLHEMGHAMGIANGLSIESYLFETSCADPLDVNSPPANLSVGFLALGGIPMSIGSGLHVYENALNCDAFNVPGFPNDLMVRATPQGVRRLISDLDVQIIQLAYGYSGVLPSSLPGWNYSVVLNQSLGQLTIFGDVGGVQADDLILARVGNFLAVSVNGGPHLLFPYAAFNTVNVLAGASSDHVQVVMSPGLPTHSDGNPIIAGVTLNLSDGGPAADLDQLLFAALGPTSYIVGSNQVSVDGDSASYSLANVEQLAIYALGSGGNSIRVDSAPAGVSKVSLYAGTGDDSIDIEQTNAGATLELLGDSGNDHVFLSLLQGDLGKLQGALNLFGGSGGDQLFAYDQLSGAPVAYVITETTLQRGSLTITHADFEALELQAGAKSDDFEIRGLAVPTDIRVGAGADSIRVDSNGADPDGTVDGVAAALTVNGGADAAGDLLIINDSGDATGDTVTVADDSVGATAGDTFFGAGGAVYYSGIDELIVDSGRAADVIHVVSTAANTQTTINGEQGSDSFVVSSLDDPDHRTGNVDGIRSKLVLWGDAGSDTLVVDDSTDATGDHLTITADWIGENAADNFFAAGGKLFYDSFVSLTVKCSDGSDAVDVRATDASTATSVHGGSGGDAFQIDSDGGESNSGTANEILSHLSLAGDDGTDTATIEDVGDLLTNTATLTDTQLGAAAGDMIFGAGGSLAYASLAELVVLAAAGGNLFRIHGTHASTATTFQGGVGIDQFSIDSNDALPGGTVDGVQSRLTLRGGGGPGDGLSLEDMNDATADVFAITADELGAEPGNSLFAAGGSLAYSGLASLSIHGGSGGNAIEVRATGAPTTILAGFNADTLWIDSNGAAPGGTVEGIRHGLTLAGGGGLDQLIIENGADLAADLLTITDNSVGVGASDAYFPSGGGLTYSQWATLIVNTSSTDDAVKLLSASSATAVAVGTGLGDDVVTVGSPGAGLEAIHSPLFVLGGVDGAHLILEDAADVTADTVHFAPSASQAGAIGAAPGDNFFGAGGALQYQQVTAVELNLGNTAGDSIFAAPSPGLSGASLLVDGNQPQTNPGDSLIVDLTGVGLPVHTLAGPSAGSYTSLDHAPIEYVDIESLQEIGAVPQIQLLSDQQANEFYVSMAAVSGELQVFDQNPPRTPIFSRPLAALSGLILDGLGGDDRLTVDGPANGLLASFPITFLAGSGNNSVEILRGSSQVDASADVGGMLTTTVSAGAAMSTRRLRQDALVLLGRGARVAVLPNGGDQGTSTLSRLRVEAGAKLDLNDNDLVVQSNALSRSGDLTGLTDLLRSGHAGGLWTGDGIASSLAAAASGRLAALGIILNVTALETPIYTRFSGQSVDANSILIKYTYYGDANLDGLVDGTDYALIDNGYNFGLPDWLNGDFNYSRAVDGVDYSLIDNAFNFQGRPLVALTALKDLASAQLQRAGEDDAALAASVRAQLAVAAAPQRRRSPELDERDRRAASRSQPLGEAWLADLVLAAEADWRRPFSQRRWG